MSDNGWHPQIKSIVVIIIIITTITITIITITITITIILEWWAVSRATFGRNPMDSKSGHVKFLRSSIGLWVALGWLFWKVDFHASGQMISISVQYPGIPWLLTAWDPHQSRPSESISPAQWMCTDWQLATWRNCLAPGGNSNGNKNHQKNRHEPVNTGSWLLKGVLLYTTHIRETYQTASAMRFDRHIFKGSHVDFIWKMGGLTSGNWNVPSRHVCKIYEHALPLQLVWCKWSLEGRKIVILVLHLYCQM